MVIHSATFAGGFASLGRLPEADLPEIAFAGRSNVGKSSLINLLVGRKNLARTSSRPGKTQEINFYLINQAFHLVDLPGYGYAKVSKVQRAKWVELVSDYLSERDQLRLLVHIIDSRHPPQELDTALMEEMKGIPFPYVIALSKADKLSGNERAASIRRVTDALQARALEVPVIVTSANTGMGRDQLFEWIKIATS